MLIPKRARIEQTQRLYERAVAEKMSEALGIMETLAVALARQDKPDEALHLADEFFSTSDPVATVQTDIKNRFETAKKGEKTSFLMDLTGLAEGRIKCGEPSAALQALDEIGNLNANAQLDSNLAEQLALAFAELGESERALKASQSISEWRYEALADVAASLCKVGEKEAGEVLASKMSASKYANTPEVVANLARIEFACGDKDKAKNNFERALKIATAFRSVEAPRLVRQNMLKAGMIDALWQPESYDEPIFTLKVVLQRALAGDAANALARLDMLGPHQTNSRDPQDRLYELSFPLIRAQVLDLLGRNAEAKIELTHAKRLALSLGAAVARARILLDVAQTHLNMNHPDEAVELARNALENVATMGMNDALSSFDLDGHKLYPSIVKILAQSGEGQKACLVAESVLEPYSNQFSSRIEQESGRSRILGEVALSNFRKNGATDALEELNAVRPARLRMALWLEALAIAKQRQDSDALDYLQTVLSDEVAKMAQSLAVGMGYQERRQAIHGYAHLLRLGFLPLAQEQQTLALQGLNEEAHFMPESKEGAKALCELGFTAKKLNHSEQAAKLFDEGLAIAAKIGTRTFPIDPSATGACAFWVKAAGDDARAKTATQTLVKGLGGNQALHERNGSTLLNLAIAFAEYEQGEIQWLDGSRLVP